MNLFTRNSPYYRLLKYLLFLLKHTVEATKLTSDASTVLLSAERKSQIISVSTEIKFTAT